MAEKYEKYEECLTCGAAVESMARHRQWHEALENVVPGLTAEVERVRGQRRGGSAYSA